MATASCWYHEEAGEFGYFIAAFEPISHDTQCQGFDFGDCIFASFSVRHDSRQVWDFRDPTPIFFTLDFNFHWRTSIAKFTVQSPPMQGSFPRPTPN